MSHLSLYFLLITIIGGSIISNSSGIKLTRFYILLKITSAEIIKLISPNSIFNKTIFGSDKKITDDHVKISFLIFISFFLSLFILSTVSIMIDYNFLRLTALFIGTSFLFIHLTLQVKNLNIDSTSSALKTFKSNRNTGLILVFTLIGISI